MNIPESIEETLIILPGSSVKLLLKVSVYDREGTPVFKEFIKHNGRTSLSFNSSDYLIFEYNDRIHKVRDTVTVSYLHMATLKEGFRKAKDFLEKSFVTDESDDNKLYIDKEHCGGFKISNLINGKSLLFMPVVSTLDNGSQKVGVDLMIDHDTSKGFVEYDTFFQLCEFINTFDLYSASKSLLNTMLMYANTVTEGNAVFQRREVARTEIPASRK